MVDQQNMALLNFRICGRVKVHPKSLHLAKEQPLLHTFALTG